MPATSAWLAAVEALLNRGIQASMRATALARRLEATAIRVDIEGISSMRACVAGGRLALIADDPPAERDGRPRESPAAGRLDATIAGPPLALLRLGFAAPGAASRGAPEMPEGAARPVVSGDAEIANSYRQLISLARPDLEEELSRLMGDLPARRLSQFVLRARSWARSAGRTAVENIGEYLQEESRDLVSAAEHDEFLQGVDELREAADRVEARLARLERRMNGTA